MVRSAPSSVQVLAARGLASDSVVVQAGQVLHAEVLPEIGVDRHPVVGRVEAVSAAIRGEVYKRLGIEDFSMIDRDRLDRIADLPC